MRLQHWKPTPTTTTTTTTTTNLPCRVATPKKSAPEAFWLSTWQALHGRKWARWDLTATTLPGEIAPGWLERLFPWARWCPSLSILPAVPHPLPVSAPPLPRCPQIGPRGVLAVNVARISRERAVSLAALPQNRPQGRSGCQRGQGGAIFAGTGFDWPATV